LLNRDDGPPKNGSQDMTGPEKGSDPNIAVSPPIPKDSSRANPLNARTAPAK
jgi:hypothetical protein